MRLSYNQFLDERAAFEQAVWNSPHLAKFCSCGPWQSAAFENLYGEHFGVDEPRGTFIIEEDGNWLLFGERNPGVFYPLEAAWMFGCPMVGESPQACLDLLQRSVQEYLGQGFGFVISGLRKGSELYRLIKAFAHTQAKHAEEFPTTDCMAIDLTEGTDAFLSRRSRSFRKSIRQIKPLNNLTFIDASSEAPENVFPRIFDIQQRSHKVADGGDIFAEPRYQSFYRHLYESLYQQGSIRTLFAQVDGQEVAYIMGAVIRDVYRGFQMSYDDTFRSYSLGNRLQIENIERSHQQGVTHYDLGMYSEYKERWADAQEVYKGFFMVL